MQNNIAPAVLPSTGAESEHAPLYTYPYRSIARGRHVPNGRCLCLEDIENTSGGPNSGIVAMQAAHDSLKRVAGIRSTDHIVAAVNPHLAPWASLVLRDTRLRIGRGPDGADIALLHEVSDPFFVAERYDRVVIASGDAIFTDAVRAIRATGIPVEVVSLQRALSARLANAATIVRYIELAISQPGRAA